MTQTHSVRIVPEPDTVKVIVLWSDGSFGVHTMPDPDTVEVDLDAPVLAILGAMPLSDTDGRLEDFPEDWSQVVVE